MTEEIVEPDGLEGTRGAHRSIARGWGGSKRRETERAPRDSRWDTMGRSKTQWLQQEAARFFRKFVDTGAIVLVPLEKQKG